VTARARFTQAEIDHAKALAENAGLRLTGYTKQPDGTVKLEFGEPQTDIGDWRDGSPLYEQRQ
jgi:hypothetical protein